MSGGEELLEQAQDILRDALMEITESDVRRLVQNAEKSLDEALYMLEYDGDGL